jgi:RNA polymerase sigma-70 factor (ECF subfamily)
MNVDELDYEQIVSAHHEDLYRFAFSLCGSPDDSAELTQETYSRLLEKGEQIRDRSRIKSWLFTTTYRIFLGWKRHARRFPHVTLEISVSELPTLAPTVIDQIDSEAVMEALLEVEEHLRTPIVLFYLEDLSYREIAELLDVTIGTVMSRLSRGKDLLRSRLSVRVNEKSASIIPFIPSCEPRKTQDEP